MQSDVCAENNLQLASILAYHNTITVGCGDENQMLKCPIWQQNPISVYIYLTEENAAFWVAADSCDIQNENSKE